MKRCVDKSYNHFWVYVPGRYHYYQCEHCFATRFPVWEWIKDYFKYLFGIYH